MLLTDAQREAVTHSGGPLLVLGGAGTGKTSVLVERFAHLVAEGTPPEAILALTFSSAAAADLRERVENAVALDAFEELSVLTFPELCMQLLREEAVETGADPFATPVSAADRLAMLLERIEELPLTRHDLRGNPSALLGSVVGRIDRLKDELVSASDYAAWAATLSEDGAREREFAEIYATHDRMLAEAGLLDEGDLVLRAFRALRERPRVRARLTERYRHVLVDEFQDCSFAQTLLLRTLGSDLTAAADPDQSIFRFRGAAEKNVQELQAEGARTIVLDRDHRTPQGVETRFWRASNERAQAQAVAADVERLITREGVEPEDVAVLVRSVKNEGQAVSVALEERAVPHRVAGAAAFFQRAEVRDLLAWLRLLVDPGDAGAVVRALARSPIELRSIDLARVTQIARRRKLDMVGALGAAMESPQIPPEARERILAFLKLYRSASGALDSTRADLFVHQLIERLGLRRQLLFAASAEVVERLVNLAKFGELAATYARRAPAATARDFARSVSAVAEAGLREEEAETAARGVQVMSMHAAKGHEFAHVYVLGLFAARMPGPRRRALEPIPDALLKEGPLPPDSKATHVASQRRLLHVAMTRAREGLVLAYPAVTDRGAAQEPSPFAEGERAAVGGEWEDREEELFGPAETLQSTFRVLRDELMTTVAEVGGRLGELRFDTDLDVSHGVVRYLEVMKLSALLERTRAGQSVAEALPEVNARLLQAVTREQREIFATSALDEYLLDAERDERTRSAVVARRSEPSLEQFLPRRGDGLLLSASDIETYRTCPLKYKFARVFRIPQEPTINQRFGIVVHQVLERFHAGESPGGSLPELLGLLDAGWRRAGFGDSTEQERQLQGKAEQALIRYHERFQGDDAEPVWFERSFSFALGAHTVRGRVDRVDRLSDGAYELIDYKTGRPKKAADLREDVQLALYSVAAEKAWDLEAARQAYYYVLDDAKVPVDWAPDDREWITETVLEVADGITSQGFEPTPSFAACSMCDYRIACPAAER